MENEQKILTIAYIVLGILVAIMLFLIYDVTLSKPNNPQVNIDISNNSTNNSNNSDNNKIIYTAYFKSNGANSVEVEKIICEQVNGICSVTMPLAYRVNGSILGYHTDKNSKMALYSVHETINLTSDMTFYVVSSAELKLQIKDSELDYLSNEKSSCTIYNEEKTCNVTLPFYNKKGYEVRGYSTNKYSLTGFLYPTNKYEISDDTILYPIYGITTRGRVVDIEKSIIVKNMVIDIGYNCSQNIYNDYIEYFTKISTRAPYLSIGSKITFLSDSSFNEIWGTSYVGMNYGPKNLRLIDVRCSNNVFNNYYATIVHEMAHTWDFYYSNFYKKDIAEQSDIVNLFNKYKDSETRPFRTYSYTNIREFFADMVRYYYLKYVDPINEYAYLSYPSDIKKVLEKYICISNNNYNDNSC